MKALFFMNDKVPALDNARDLFVKGGLVSFVGGVTVLVGTGLQMKAISMHNTAVHSIAEISENFNQ